MLKQQEQPKAEISQTPIQLINELKKDDDNIASLFTLKLGIIVNDFNIPDIMEYEKELIAITKKLPVELYIIGYKKPELKTDDVFSKLNYHYVKPVSIIHYFKLLKSLKLDLIFIPLIFNEFNKTSENYNKFIEAGLMSIPVLAPNIYPYNKIVCSTCGYLYNNNEEVILNIYEILKNIAELKNKGLVAKKEILRMLSFNEENIEFFLECFN